MKLKLWLFEKTSHLQTFRGDPLLTSTLIMLLKRHFVHYNLQKKAAINLLLSRGPSSGFAFANHAHSQWAWWHAENAITTIMRANESNIRAIGSARPDCVELQWVRIRRFILPKGETGKFQSMCVSGRKCYYLHEPLASNCFVACKMHPVNFMQYLEGCFNLLLDTRVNEKHAHFFFKFCRWATV